MIRKGQKATNKNHITYRERFYQKSVPVIDVEANCQAVDDCRGFARHFHKEMALQEIEILGDWNIGI